MNLHNFYTYLWKMEKRLSGISCYFIQHVGDHCTLGLFNNFKNQSQCSTATFKTNQLSITIMHHE